MNNLQFHTLQSGIIKHRSPFLFQKCYPDNNALLHRQLVFILLPKKSFWFLRLISRVFYMKEKVKYARRYFLDFSTAHDFFFRVLIDMLKKYQISYSKIIFPRLEATKKSIFLIKESEDFFYFSFLENTFKKISDAGRGKR